MVRVSPRQTVRFTVAVAFCLFSVGGQAQPVPAGNIPSISAAPSPAPPPLATPSESTTDLAPMPDLGVEWPDPVRIDAAPAAAGPTETKGITADKLQRYRVMLEGAEPLGATFKTRFDQLSALVTNQNKPANAAQINRRARDDEDLGRQLLAAQGHYDAAPSPRSIRTRRPVRRSSM